MPSAEPYHTRGGVQKTKSYGITFKYLRGTPGETGFGSKSTAEQVSAGWDGSRYVALVTGAATGLGYESARVLALRGAHVVVAVRTQARAEETADRLRRDVPGAKVTPLELDLSSLASVRQAADAFRRSGLPLNILLLNAGVMATPAFTPSRDGFELQWATNHLGHFALTQRLKDLLISSATTSGLEGRVVVLSSMGHYLFEVPGGVDFEALRSGKNYVPFNAYGVSKLCNVLFTRELQRQLTGKPVVAVCCHPGAIFDTDLKRHMAGVSSNSEGGSGGKSCSLQGLALSLTFMMMKPVTKTIPQGTSTQMLLATAPRVEAGEYYSDCNVAPSSAASQDGDLGARLWEFSEQAVRAEEEAAAATPAPGTA
ncbi:hypothetical protein Vretimale_19143 [Volvox reticuliferus]|uniref:Uncharacterized protein n=1 Tax=Volvox reticuliferus TaxID=1737510 RepID=A0A8J4GW70_9CHLO|nr:hypothetical protein Vretifemale_16527 [Volvox reticuliferus]GIM16500.1 hypothetical protein Vretimale_19143 [Volvox reticuliferus]